LDAEERERELVPPDLSASVGVHPRPQSVSHSFINIPDLPVIRINNGTGAKDLFANHMVFI
jgi:hypothetical protein